MLGWVITCHDEVAQEMLLKLEARFGPPGAMPCCKLLARVKHQHAQPDDVRRAA